VLDEGSLGVKIIVIVPFSSLAAQSKSGVKIGLNVLLHFLGKMNSVASI
jgi:hypothetical protein